MKPYYPSGNVARWFVSTVWNAIRCGIVVRGQAKPEIFFKAKDQEWIPNREELGSVTHEATGELWEFNCDRMNLKMKIAKAVLADPQTRIPILIKDLEELTKKPLCCLHKKNRAELHIAWLEDTLKGFASSTQINPNGEK